MNDVHINYDANNHMNLLLDFARGKSETYNKIANMLYKDLNIQGASITLVCLYIHEMLKEG